MAKAERGENMSDKTIDDGGPAFPMGFHPEGNSADTQGMSLRDWFAGQALAVLADPASCGEARPTARYCYEMADAFIAARKAKS